MAKNTKPSITRLKEILRRQDPPKWGDQYQAAIYATRTEAPGRSRPAQIWSAKLQRHCHALSQVEQKVLLLALFHPKLFELHEQRMLATEPRPHPLCGHPSAVGLDFAGLKGTIDVCRRLDLIKRHHCVSFKDMSGQLVPVAFPWVGDFLLFLMDDDGPYCVNWTVKGSEDEFERKLQSDKPSRNPQRDAFATTSRHAIEELYYQDAGIRTVRIVGKNISDQFANNLRAIYLDHHQTPNVDQSIREEIIDRLRASLHTKQSPIEVLLSAVHQYDIAFADARIIFHQAIWNRDLRVELFERAILIDQPLHVERTDPFKRFEYFFSRKGD